MLIFDQQQRQVNAEISGSMNEAELIVHFMESAFEKRDEVTGDTCANIVADDTFLKSI